jgi:hypothetical protein
MASHSCAALCSRLATRPSFFIPGLTPLGTSLDQKIIGPMLMGPARQNALQKPLLVICITDGTPAGEPKETIFNVILRTNQELQRTRVSGIILNSSGLVS